MTNRPGQTIVRTLALVALAVILIGFGVRYFNARSSEDGTTRDDSPAAEAGLRKGDGPQGGGR